MCIICACLYLLGVPSPTRLLVLFFYVITSSLITYLICFNFVRSNPNSIVARIKPTNMLRTFFSFILLDSSTRMLSSLLLKSTNECISLRTSSGSSIEQESALVKIKTIGVDDRMDILIMEENCERAVLILL